ncbi:hypothetical protein ABZT51_45635 [Streptomyces sp. NPDC005373]|uniref:hypothetical protein n=1 Tax=Streptomyces sp. NPDC005373 TaxID=3156879 RepID=UPI0033B83376
MDHSTDIHGLGRTKPGWWSLFGEADFEDGDSSVSEAQVRAGGLQPLVESAVVGGELEDALLECGVHGVDPLDGFPGPFGLRVADLAQEFTMRVRWVRISAWAASTRQS